jgi:hypothetical protein
MRSLNRVLTLVLFGLVLCTGVVRADSINALNMSITSLSGCPTASCFPWSVDASSIVFTMPSNGVLQIDAYSAALPKDIKWLTFIVPMGGLDIGCASNIFSNCTVTNPHPNITIIRFAVGTIYPSQYFSINFDCASGSSCAWPVGVKIAGHSGLGAPEPSSMTLIGIGIAAILTRRKARMRVSDSLWSDGQES